MERGPLRLVGERSRGLHGRLRVGFLSGEDLRLPEAPTSLPYEWVVPQLAPRRTLRIIALGLLARPVYSPKTCRVPLGHHRHAPSLEAFLLECLALPLRILAAEKVRRLQVFLSHHLHLQVRIEARAQRQQVGGITHVRRTGCLRNLGPAHCIVHSRQATYRLRLGLAIPFSRVSLTVGVVGVEEALVVAGEGVLVGTKATQDSAPIQVFRTPTTLEEVAATVAPQQQTDLR